MRGSLSEGATAADESASPHWAGRAANLGCAVHSTSGLPQIRLREAKERNQPVAPYQTSTHVRAGNTVTGDGCTRLQSSAPPRLADIAGVLHPENWIRP